MHLPRSHAGKRGKKIMGTGKVETVAENTAKYTVVEQERTSNARDQKHFILLFDGLVAGTSCSLLSMQCLMPLVGVGTYWYVSTSVSTLAGSCGRSLAVGTAINNLLINLGCYRYRPLPSPHLALVPG